MAGDTIKIDTMAVRNAAEKVSRLNRNINYSLDELIRRVSSLNGSWDGSGSENALATFSRMRSDYYQNRYDQVDNFVRFMMNNVAGGYESAENNNISLSDAFK